MIIRCAVITALCSIAVFLPGQRAVQASSTNSATLFRYPWIAGEMRTRTQGQASVSDHGNVYGLTYAVDWGLAGQSTLLFAANSGTLRCHPQQPYPFDGFGDYVSIYNSYGQVTSIVAHMQQGARCYPFIENVAYDILQGQFIGVGDNSGHSTGNHIHFQVNAGDDEIGSLISVPFTLSDHSPDGNGISFPDNANCTLYDIGCLPDGPSDNAGTGYASQNPVTTDPTIINTYLSNGGASASWWNVGAPYATPVGPCVYANTAFVHSCPTLAGTFTVQDYIRWDGLRSALAKDASGVNAYRISGQDWMLMGTSFRSSGLTP